MKILGWRFDEILFPETTSYVTLKSDLQAYKKKVKTQ